MEFTELLEIVGGQLRKLDWSRVVDDVRPLLEPSGRADLLTQENLMQALGTAAGGSAACRGE